MSVFVSAFYGSTRCKWKLRGSSTSENEGFRKVEIHDAVLYMNGKKIIVKWCEPT